MSQTNYDRIYALSQNLMRICEETHLQMNAKRKEREAWHKGRREPALPEEGQAKDLGTVTDPRGL